MTLKLSTAFAIGIAAMTTLAASAGQSTTDNVSPELGAPAPTIYGGGATLPAIGYIGKGWFNAADPTHSARQSNPGTDSALFPTYTAKAFGAKKAVVSYCQTGSGTGRNVIIGTNASGTAILASGACPDFSATPSGFGAPNAEADFAASDAPLSLSEFNRGLANKGATHTQVVQFPVIAGAIAIVYNNSSIPSGTHFALTNAQVCGIFAGTITNWSQLGQPTKAIRVTYRSDGSGTSFGFTNHLSATCAAAGINAFKTTDTFAGSATSPAAISPLPAGAVGASGNPGVVNSVAATDGAIGYGEVADVVLRGGTVNYATVDGFDPLAVTAPKITTTSDGFLNGVDGNGRPVIQSNAGPAAGCVVLANPNSYAAPTGYPIVAVSYLLAYNTGNRNASATTALLSAPFNFGIKRGTKTVGPNTGFAFLSDNLTTQIGKCVN